ncbi:MAG TPA: site-specific DNA-methyltransferase [Verrucomicrobiae bacterium]|nr:site-specific DNA-methyltransferase [Verrucomicrobiae bacterium]
MKYSTAGPKTIDEIPTVHRLVQGDARNLSFIADESIHLVVTSPPYWTLKRYNDSDGQMGHIADYEQFLAELNRVWSEVFRVLVPGGRLVCVVGDVCLSRRENNGRHTVVPLHADICVQCRRLGFDNLNPIIWHKISNASYEVSNGSKFLGKPYEPNAIIKNDIEFLLMQRKPGGYRKPTEEQRRLSLISKEKFDKWFQQFWTITGASTKEHPAPYPLELASRLVQMFSFAGDTVLDPFCGTGTTMVAALKHGRNSLGLELDTAYCKLAASRLLNENTNLFGHAQLQIDLKPHLAVETVAALQETAPPCKTRTRRKSVRNRS